MRLYVNHPFALRRDVPPRRRFWFARPTEWRRRRHSERRQHDQAGRVFLEHPIERRLTESRFPERLRRLCERVGVIRRADQSAVTRNECQLRTNGLPLRHPIMTATCTHIKSTLPNRRRVCL